MQLNKKQAQELWNKYLNGNCSEEEKRFVETWYNYAIDEQTGQYPVITKTTKKFRSYYLAAAVMVVALAFGLYVNFLKEPDDKGIHSALRPDDDIQPGENKALLTLANGQVIQLSGEKQGLVISGNEMIYSDGSPVEGLDNDQTGVSPATQLLQLSTPKGGQYHLILSDGTRVWLNSASTLTYPAAFDGQDRKVTLEGEGFFSVDSRQPTVASKKPFIVKTRHQETIVLGTEFNISAYSDENIIKTTLVNGSVKVTTLNGPQSLILKPGEESIFGAGSIYTHPADIQAAIAWKDGLFYFDNTPLEAMMRQISRWYDLDVRYANGVPQERFTGKMLRSLTLSEVLNFLKGSDITFKREGKVLTIYKTTN